MALSETPNSSLPSSEGPAPTPAHDDASAAPATLARRRARIRWLALALVAGVVALLALGWVADTLAQVVPAIHSQAGATSQTQALGFDTLTLQVAPTPPRAGANETLTFMLTDATGAPVANARIQVALTMAAMDMSGGAGLAQPTATPGAYRLVGGFAMSGAWTLALAVTLPGQPALHTTFTLLVQ